MPPIDEARQRADALIAATEHYEELGHGKLAGESRIVAGLLLETLDTIEAERSARVALQARCETLQGIIGKAAYEAMR